MFRLITAAISIAILSGCGMISTKPIAPEKFTELKGKKLAVTTPFKAKLNVLTVGGALMAGTVGFSSEDDISTVYRLQDPAFSISKNVEKKLAQKAKIKVSEHKKLSEPSRDPEEIAPQFPNADYILDINTVNAFFGYKPFDFGSYRLLYNAKLQLVEADTKTIVAESICHTESDEDQSIGYDEFLANNAKLLKAEYARAIQLCTKEFSQSILRI